MWRAAYRRRSLTLAALRLSSPSYTRSPVPRNNTTQTISDTRRRVMRYCRVIPRSPVADYPPSSLARICRSKEIVARRMPRYATRPVRHCINIRNVSSIYRRARKIVARHPHVPETLFLKKKRKERRKKEKSSDARASPYSTVTTSAEDNVCVKGMQCRRGVMSIIDRSSGGARCE